MIIRGISLIIRKLFLFLRRLLPVRHAIFTTFYILAVIPDPKNKPSSLCTQDPTRGRKKSKVISGTVIKCVGWMRQLRFQSAMSFGRRHATRSLVCCWLTVSSCRGCNELAILRQESSLGRLLLRINNLLGRPVDTANPLQIDSLLSSLAM